MPQLIYSQLPCRSWIRATGKPDFSEGKTSESGDFGGGFSPEAGSASPRLPLTDARVIHSATTFGVSAWPL
jgi:hypothetical protein